jgi:DNA-directed RNA polymerase specialized sigma24 family protein
MVSTTVDTMADTVQMASAASSRDPAVGLKAVRALRALVERLETLQVENARDQGWTWEQIAQLLGVTRQAVHKKYAGGRGPLRRRDSRCSNASPPRPGRP